MALSRSLARGHGYERKEDAFIVRALAGHECGLERYSVQLRAACAWVSVPVLRRAVRVWDHRMEEAEVIDECEIPEFYATSEPIAAKDHVCCECSAPITKGEKHLYCRGKWDGSFLHYRQHLICAEACMAIRDNFNEFECIEFGGLKSYWSEIIRDYDRETCREKESWKKLRSLMAAIAWRERKSRCT